MDVCLNLGFSMAIFIFTCGLCDNYYSVVVRLLSLSSFFHAENSKMETDAYCSRTEKREMR